MKRPFILTTNPAWSPDGKTIAIGVSNPSPAGYYGTVVGVPAAGGPDQLINPHHWAGVLSVAWMSDGRGLLIVGTTPGIATSTQLWYVPISKSEPVQLTNDGNSYSDVSVTTAGNALVAVKHEIISRLLAQDAGNPAALREITNPGPYYTGVSGMTLTPDGKLIYCSRQASGLDLWMRGLEEDAKPQRLTNDSAIVMQPCLSSDGKRLVFASNRGTQVFHIWSLDRDTGSLRQLTSGQGEMSPALSPDGKLLIYRRVEEPGLWKVSTSRVAAENGSAAEKFTSAHYSEPVFSPDGQTIAFTFSDEKVGRRPRFGIMPATGGEPIKIFDFAVPEGGSLLQFTPDGSALSYAASQGGVAQAWSQPLDGGPPKQLTQFHSEGIFAYAWTKDGKQLVLSRGTLNSDAVLMEETK